MTPSSHAPNGPRLATCPRCEHPVRRDVQRRCDACRTTFSDEALRSLWQLQDLRRRVRAWAGDGLVPGDMLERVLALTDPELRELETRLGARPSSAAPSTAAVTTSPADAGGTIAPTPSPAEAQPPPTPGGRFSLREIGTYLLAERTLNGLLGLGSLLILSSALVISAFNPTRLAPIPHLGALLLTTALFFGSGWLVERLLGLRRTGGALLTIACGLVPLDVWTLGQPMLMDWDPSTSWVAASAACAGLCLLLCRLHPRRPFAVLATVAAASTVVAAAYRTGLPLAWGLALLPTLATGALLVAARLRGSVLAWALHGAGLVAVPLVLALELGGRLAGADVSEYAVGFAWWTGAAHFGLLGRLTRSSTDVHVAAWLVPVAVLLTLTKAPWTVTWDGPWLALLVLAYIVLGSRGHPSAAPLRLREWWLAPAFPPAAVLTVIAAVWPATPPAMALTWTILTIGYALAAALVRVPLLGYAPGWLGGVAAAAWLRAAGVPADWYGVSSASAAVAYVCLAWAAARLRVFPVSSRFVEALRSPLVLPALAAWGVVPLLSAGAPFDAAALLLAGLAAALAAHAFGWRVAAYAAVAVVPPAWAYAAAWGSVPGAVRQVSWLVMAAAALAMAEWAVRRTGEHARPFVDTILGLGAWRARYAAPTFLLAASASVIALGDVVGAASDSPGLEVLTLTGVLVLNAVAARARRASPPVYVVAGGLPIWLMTGLHLLVPSPDVLLEAAALALLAGVSMEVARRLAPCGRGFALPWLVCGYGLAVLVPWPPLSGPLLDASHQALWLGALGAWYLAVLWRVRRPGWLYPTQLVLFGAGLTALETLLQPVVRSMQRMQLELALASLTAAAVLVGADEVARRTGPVAAGRARWASWVSAPLLAAPWARPLTLVSVGVIAAGLVGTLDPARPDLGLATWTPALLPNISAAVAFGVVGARRRAERLCQVAALLGGAGIERVLLAAGVPLPLHPLAWTSLFGLLSVVGTFASRRAASRERSPWAWALGTWLGFAALASISVSVGVGARSELAVNLGLAGLVWLVQGYVRRRWWCVYLGAGLALGGLLLELWAGGVSQAQLYACAVGTYLLITAYLEWRRGISATIKPRLELGGLVALLGTSLAQSMGALDGDLNRHLYVVLLLGESLALTGLGAALRWRRTFSAGLLGAACAAVILIAEPLRAIDTWYTLASAGLVLIATVLLLERRRQHVERWLGSWRQAVEAWD